MNGKAARHEAQKELARRTLVAFTKYTFNQYHAEAVHRLIGSYLDRVVSGDLPRLIILAPPQHGKSEMVSVRLPAFWLARNPDLPVILTSYAASLAESKSRQARNILLSDQFHDLFPDVQLDPEQRSVRDWKLAGRRGELIAAGVGGPITGHGAMLGIIDDPVENWEQAQSQAARDRVYDWYRTTFRTRLWEGGRIILIMTRWHGDDLAGRLLVDQTEHWELLRLPALCEGPNDPLERQEGEALAPKRFSVDALQQIKSEIGNLAWSAEYQGRPIPLEGALIDTTKLQYLAAYIAAEDDHPLYCRFWDLAVGLKEQHAYTVGAKLAVTRDGRWILLDIVRGRWAWPDARKVIAATAENDGRDVVIGLEDVGFQRAAYDDLIRMPELGTYRIWARRPRGDKAVRAGGWAARVDAEKFYVVQGMWVQAFVDEAASFPFGPTADQVDAISGAAQILTERSAAKLKISLNPFYGQVAQAVAKGVFK